MARPLALSPVVTPWDARITRARELSAHSVGAREILTFFAALAEYQRGLYTSAHAEAQAAPDTPFVDAIALRHAASAAPAFLQWLVREAPASEALRRAAASDHLSRLNWADRLRQDLVSEAACSEAAPFLGEAPEAFIARSLLQPCAEAAAISRRDERGLATRAAGDVSARCPVCADIARVGVLREEGHGAKKTLQCGRCFTEWSFPRLMCPACRETRFDALPVFTAEAFPHVRVEACETCRAYLKTIDLTVNGLAIPVVDDVASLTLDLWAGERGYGPLARPR